MSINLGHPQKKEHSVFTLPKQLTNGDMDSGDNTFNFRPQRVPVTKKSTNMVSGHSKGKDNSRVVHFPKDQLEYDEDDEIDDRINPLTNTTITSHIPKLPVPKIKQQQKQNFEAITKPINELIDKMQEQKFQAMIQKEAELEVSRQRSLSQSTYQKQVPLSR